MIERIQSNEKNHASIILPFTIMRIARTILPFTIMRIARTPFVSWS